MAAPRRALASTLLRTVAQSSVRASRPSVVTNALGSSPRCQARRGATTFQTTSVRWYSSNQNDSLPGSRSYNFKDVQDQLKINDELDKSGREETKDGAKKVVFVDVREPEELIQTGKIPGAINIPITSAVQSFHIPDDDFVDLYGYERPPKDAHLMFYCKAGVRARSAAGLAQHAGWGNVGEYPGSWLDWEGHNGQLEVRSEQGMGWRRILTRG